MGRRREPRRLSENAGIACLRESTMEDVSALLPAMTASSPSENPAPLSSSPPGWRRWLIPGMAAALIALVALIYLPVRHFDFVNLDDETFIAANPYIQKGFNTESIQWALMANFFEPSRGAEYWQPITLISRILDFALFGRDPG